LSSMLRLGMAALRKALNLWAYDDYVQFYVDNDFCIIPIIPETKKPNLNEWKELQQRKPSPDEIQEWFGAKESQRRPSIAVIAGRISDNLVIIDFDELEWYSKFFAAPFLTTAEIESTTLVDKTSRGVHVFLRSYVPMKSYNIPELHVNVQSEGRYALVPPSIHPSGAQYTFLTEPRAPRLIENLPDVLKNRIEGMNFQVPAVLDPIAEGNVQVHVRPWRRFPPQVQAYFVDTEIGDRHHRAVGIASTMLNEWKFPLEMARQWLYEWNDLVLKRPIPVADIDHALHEAQAKGYVYGKQTIQPAALTDDEQKASEALAKDPALLFKVKTALGGLVGEDNNRLLLFVLNLAKQSVEISGQSAGGKRTLVDEVLRGFPDDSYQKVTGVTDKALRYLAESIRTLYIAERGALESHGEETTAAFDAKMVISEGKLSILVPEKDEETGKIKSTTIETKIENIISTSTQLSLPEELENRLWRTSIDDSEGQNAKVRDYLLDSAAQANDDKPDFAPQKQQVQSLVKLIEVEAPKAVIVPFAPALKSLLPSDKTRVRRDTTKLLALVRYIAILHYKQRPSFTGKKGIVHVVALPADLYAALRIGYAAFVETRTGFNASIRRGYEIAKTLSEITTEAVQNAGGVSDRTAIRYVKALRKQGILIESEKRGRIPIYTLAPNAAKLVVVEKADVLGRFDWKELELACEMVAATGSVKSPVIDPLTGDLVDLIGGDHNSKAETADNQETTQEMHSEMAAKPLDDFSALAATNTSIGK